MNPHHQTNPIPHLILDRLQRYLPTLLIINLIILLLITIYALITNNSPRLIPILDDSTGSLRFIPDTSINLTILSFFSPMIGIFTLFLFFFQLATSKSLIRNFLLLPTNQRNIRHAQWWLTIILPTAWATLLILLTICIQILFGANLPLSTITILLPQISILLFTATALLYLLSSFSINAIPKPLHRLFLITFAFISLIALFLFYHYLDLLLDNNNIIQFYPSFLIILPIGIIAATLGYKYPGDLRNSLIVNLNKTQTQPTNQTRPSKLNPLQHLTGTAFLLATILKRNLLFALLLVLWLPTVTFILYQINNTTDSNWRENLNESLFNNIHFIILFSCFIIYSTFITGIFSLQIWRRLPLTTTQISGWMVGTSALTWLIIATLISIAFHYITKSNINIAPEFWQIFLLCSGIASLAIPLLIRFGMTGFFISAFLFPIACVFISNKFFRFYREMEIKQTTIFGFNTNITEIGWTFPWIFAACILLSWACTYLILTHSTQAYRHKPQNTPYP